MDWIKERYDRVLLAVAGLLAAALGAFILLNALGFADAFADRNSTKPPDQTISPPPVEPIEKALEKLNTPAAWKAHAGYLLVSRPYILKDGVIVDPVGEDAMLHPPVPNAWLMEYDLDYSRPDILSTDPDGDGFTVLEEFTAGSDPTDSGSTPPYWTKLRLEAYLPDPIRLRFTSTPDGGQTFGVNLLSPDANGRLRPVGSSRFLPLGETIEVSGDTYKLVDYTEKFLAQESGLEKDVSELVIKNEATGETIVLIKDVVVNSPSSAGKLRNLLDDSVIDVRRNAEFTIAQEPDRSYKLVDITESDALIQDLKSGEKHKLERVK